MRSFRPLVILLLMSIDGGACAQLLSNLPAEAIQAKFDSITRGGKISAESYLDACHFVTVRGREMGFWRQVLSELEKGNKTSEVACVQVLGRMLEIDASARSTNSIERRGAKSGEPTLSVCLGPEVVKELIRRGEHSDRFNVNHYAIALARARVADASGFFRSVLQRQPATGHQDSAQFHAAVGLAQLGDRAGFEWLIVHTSDTLSSVHSAAPDGVNNWNLNTCSLAALECLSGRKDLKTREEWQSWWLEIDKNMLGKRFVHMVDACN